MKTIATLLFFLSIASLSAETPSQSIDRLVEAAIKEQKLAPNAPASDPEFLRRTYLNIAGRIPTADEAMDFLEGRESNKRALLIDQLLNSDGYVSHSFNSHSGDKFGCFI